MDTCQDHLSMTWNKQPCPYCEIDQLRAELEILTEAHAESNLRCAIVVQRLRKALEVYANKYEWSMGEGHHWELRFNSSTIDGDGWLTAEQALKDTE